VIDMSWNKLALGIAILALFITPACGSDESDGPTANGSLNVAQGGPQDFALFRKLVEEGEVPAPDTLEELGFFAEHAFDLPPADCGKTLCLHPSLAVAPRFDDSNWTMAFVAMNTAVDPAQLPRPAQHLVFVVELSDATQGLPLALASELAVAKLRPEDRVSVVAYGSDAELRLLGAPPADSALVAEALAGSTQAGVDLYAGLAAAGRAVRDIPTFDGAHRIVLITSGRADDGITDPERIVALGEGMAASGIAFGIVGVGDDYDARIPAALGSLGAGTYSYALDGSDFTRILEDEGDTLMFPLATDFTMTLKPQPGYRVGRVYGAPRAQHQGDSIIMQLPALFIGQRSGAKDVAGGRRGGGGGLFVELIADSGSTVGSDAPAFQIEADWQSSGGPESSSHVVNNPLGPGLNPASMWPVFTDEGRAKPYMMLNMYLSLRASVVLYDGGDCLRAKGVADMMAPTVEGWQGKYDDPDISSDYSLLLQLRANLEEKCQGESSRPESFEGGCFFL
jgi:Ca-activated chloride channel family protein